MARTGGPYQRWQQEDFLGLLHAYVVVRAGTGVSAWMTYRAPDSPLQGEVESTVRFLGDSRDNSLASLAGVMLRLQEPLARRLEIHRDLNL